MADSIVLTDGAKFKCSHMPVAQGTSAGITVSPVASKTTVGGAKPILNGATVGGFTLAAGCNFQVLGVSTPCLSFKLPPASGSLSEKGQAVYTEADLSAIAAIPSTGNATPGLAIQESQTKLKA